MLFSLVSNFETPAYPALSTYLSNASGVNGWLAAARAPQAVVQYVMDELADGAVEVGAQVNGDWLVVKAEPDLNDWLAPARPLSFGDWFAQTYGRQTS
jgi:hypothetical protein